MATITKNQKIENYVRARISTGAWKPGSRVESYTRIGERLDVSVASVKNVFSRLAAEGLIERTKRKGTFVADCCTKAKVVVLCKSELLASPVGYFYQRLLELVKNCVEGESMQMVLAMGQGDGQDFIDSSCVFSEGMNEGILGVIDLSGPHGDLEKELEEMGVPVVGVSSAVPMSINSVVLDYNEMIRVGVDILDEYGYDDYVVMSVEPPLTERTRSYEESLTELQESHPSLSKCSFVRLPWPGWDYSGIYESFKLYLNNNKLPKAIFFLDDAICDVALRVIQEYRISVPDQLGVLTAANAGRKFSFPKAINRVEFNCSEIAATAFEMLRTLIESPKKADKLLYVKPRVRPGLSL